MSIFGHCPAHDDFYLVVCNHCSQVVKPQAFQKHCGEASPREETEGTGEGGTWASEERVSWEVTWVVRGGLAGGVRRSWGWLQRIVAGQGACLSKVVASRGISGRTKRFRKVSPRILSLEGSFKGKEGTFKILGLGNSRLCIVSLWPGLGGWGRSQLIPLTFFFFFSQYHSP